MSWNHDTILKTHIFFFGGGVIFNPINWQYYIEEYVKRMVKTNNYKSSSNLKCLLEMGGGKAFQSKES